MCGQKPSVALILHYSGWGLILEYQLAALKIPKIIPAGLYTDWSLIELRCHWRKSLAGQELHYLLVSHSQTLLRRALIG